MVTVINIHDSKLANMIMRVLTNSYLSLKTIIAYAGNCGNIANEK